MYEVTIIQPDGTTVVEKLPKQPEMEYLHKAVQGYYERVEINYLGKKWCNMWVNEEGIIKGMQHNAKATALCHGSLARYSSPLQPDFYQIYGPVAIVRKVAV